MWFVMITKQGWNFVVVGNDYQPSENFVVVGNDYQPRVEFRFGGNDYSQRWILVVVVMITLRYCSKSTRHAVTRAVRRLQTLSSRAAARFEERSQIGCDHECRLRTSCAAG